MTQKITISGIGCCLVDRLYNHIPFGSETFFRYLSHKSGDGGLVPGRLVFREEFENFCRESVETVIKALTGGRPADSINLGGPAIVAMIHAAQMAGNSGVDFYFFGQGGDDDEGRYITSLLNRLPVKSDGYRLVKGITPSTIVFSDPSWEQGTGERVFINSIGVAGNYLPDHPDKRFFMSDIAVFGGTALVPQIHDHLAEMLGKVKSNGGITIVNTVYDFRNEKAAPQKRWPLGNSDDSYRLTDLLITDREEALRLSGTNEPGDAMDFFIEQGARAVIVTNGSRNIRLYANKDSIFKEIELTELPVSLAITNDLRNPHAGDTTGCGDNFAGGVVYSVTDQLRRGIKRPDLYEACAWGIASGGFCCFYIGGTFHEEFPGQKFSLIHPYYEKYRKQTGI